MGLESAQSPQRGPKVENYISLFQQVQQCSRGSASSLIINVVMTACLLLGARLVAH